MTIPNILDYFDAEHDSKSAERLAKRLWDTYVLLGAAAEKLDQAIKIAPDAANTSALLRVRSLLLIASRRLNNDQLAQTRAMMPVNSGSTETEADGSQPETA